MAERDSAGVGHFPVNAAVKPQSEPDWPIDAPRGNEFAKKDQKKKSAFAIRLSDPKLETLSGFRSSRMAAGRAGNSPSLVSQ